MCSFYVVLISTHDILIERKTLNMFSTYPRSVYKSYIVQVLVKGFVHDDIKLLRQLRYCKK